MLPRDVDLTLKMDFNNREVEPKTIKLEKTKKDESYKRYNEYKDKSFSSTTSDSLDSFSSGFIPPFRFSSTTLPSTGSDSLFNRLYSDKIIKKEERVCWRKLYRDPEIYGKEPQTAEEAIERIKNYNFALGSKTDRLKIHYQKLRDMEDFCAGYYCDCCGKKLNKRNCLSHRGSLCQSCDLMISRQIHSIKL